MSKHALTPNTLPARSGVGFKPVHFNDIQATPPQIGFFEIHAENYMGAGGQPHAQLAALRADYALSIHGVGLSIGGAGPLDQEHLDRLKALCDRYEPESFSEHLAWSSHGAAYLNDLLPLPYNEETLALVGSHIDQVQDHLGRRMLLENPSSYMQFEQTTIPEVEFLAEITRRTGCGLLLDVNNVFISAQNQRSSAQDYLAAFPLEAVGELHLGGHEEEELPSGKLLIDTHSAPVVDPVWALYAEVIRRVGPLPTLIEWDNDVPEWAVLAEEAARAEVFLQPQEDAHVRAI